MKWLICATLCIALMACSENSRKIIKDDLPASDNALLGDEDDLLSDDPVIPVDKPVATDDDAAITDDTVTDSPVVVDDDTTVTDTPVITDDTLPDDDSLIPDDSVTDDPVTDTITPDNDVPTGYCGDGIKNGTESCDDGSEKNGQYGYCNSICTGPGPRCGDGNTDIGYETCDDGFLLNGTYDHCNEFCTGPASRCGDGVTDADAGEVCDDGDELNGTYDHCNATCSGDGPYCGDGKVDADNEDCDKSKDQYCTGNPGGGCGGAQYRLRKCNNTTCKWGAWSNCGPSDGQDATNFGDCPDPC